MPAELLLDMEGRVVPRDRWVEVREERCGPALGEAARAVGDVGLEQRPDPRPVRLDGDRPVALELAREASQRTLRRRQEGLEHGRRALAAEHEAEVVADLSRWGPPHILDLILETCEW